MKEPPHSHFHGHRGWQLIKSFKTHNRKLETKQEETITGSVSAHLTFTSHFNNTEKERVLKCYPKPKYKMAQNTFLSSQCANMIMWLGSCKQAWQKHTSSHQKSTDPQIFKIFIFRWIPLISDITKCIKMLQCGKKVKINKPLKLKTQSSQRLPTTLSPVSHMASKWKRWASCLFSRSSAFCNTQTIKVWYML